MADKPGTIMTLTFRGWIFTHDGKWLTMKKGQNTFTVSGATIEMNGLLTFAQGWVAAEMFVGENP